MQPNQQQVQIEQLNKELMGLELKDPKDDYDRIVYKRLEKELLELSKPKQKRK